MKKIAFYLAPSKLRPTLVSKIGHNKYIQIYWINEKSKSPKLYSQFSERKHIVWYVKNAYQKEISIRDIDNRLLKKYLKFIFEIDWSL
jgi:hypothetical protein